MPVRELLALSTPFFFGLVPLEAGGLAANYSNAWDQVLSASFHPVRCCHVCPSTCSARELLIRAVHPLALPESLAPGRPSADSCAAC